LQRKEDLQISPSIAYPPLQIDFWEKLLIENKIIKTLVYSVAKMYQNRKIYTRIRNLLTAFCSERNLE